MFKHLVPILTIIAIGLAACPANNNIDSLVASKQSLNPGSNTFNVDPTLTSSSQNYIYNFPTAFQTTPVLAIGISAII